MLVESKLRRLAVDICRRKLPGYKLNVVGSIKNNYSSKTNIDILGVNQTLVDEFTSNMEQLLLKNRYTNADVVFDLVNNRLSTQNNPNALRYFRGLYSVVEAFTSTPGANTEENRQTISNFLQIVQERIINEGPQKKPLNITVCGDMNYIAYALVSRIADGEMFGTENCVNLRLCDLTNVTTPKQLEGMIMELQDFASPYLISTELFDNFEKSLEMSDYVIILNPQYGSKLDDNQRLKKSAQFFSDAGQSLKRVSGSINDQVKIVVSGEFCNLGSMIISQILSSAISPRNISSVMRLKHNKGVSQIAKKANVDIDQIECFAVWGAYGNTSHPDITHTFINGQPANHVIKDNNWLSKTLVSQIQNSTNSQNVLTEANPQLPQYISSAQMSNAIVNHVHDLANSTQGKWTSMAVHSSGEYGVTPGLYFSFPVVTAYGQYSIVNNLQIDEFTAEALEKSHQHLLSQRNSVSKFLS